jgi:phage terminase small subunit
MPILKNPRHERVAQLLASVKTATDAYEQAGYKPHKFDPGYRP